MQDSTKGTDAMRPTLSVILPAHDEAGLIGPCLDAVIGSDWPRGNRNAGLEVIVVANGCSDATVAEAQKRHPAATEAGIDLRVLDLPEGGKLGALNAGDAAARAGNRVYLDADVTVSPRLLLQLHGALSQDGPVYASGQVLIPKGQSALTRAYRRIYRQVPFMTHGVPGCGVFGVNAAGRKRWDDWPDVISDDTFARLNFAPHERIGVSATYHWPLVEGLGPLVRVRRRQNAGVEELRDRFPALFQNEDKPRLSTLDKLRMGLRDPLGFAVYTGVALAVKLRPAREGDGWARGR